MEIRETEERDAAAVVRLLLAADDSRVVSADGFIYRHRTLLPRAQTLSHGVEIAGTLVACGAAALDTSTTTEGAGWAFVTVHAAHRSQGIGTELGERLVDHLREIGATKPTSFFRASEDGERWGSRRDGPSS